MSWLITDIVIFLLCAFFAGIMIPQILLISFRRNLFDEPDERKIHTSKVPRLGGIAFIPVIFFTLSLMTGLAELLGFGEMVSMLNLNLKALSFPFCALLLLYIVGMADDLVGVRYRAKFVVQIVCGVLLIGGGLAITNFHGFLGVEQVPGVVTWITTLGLAVFILNAINLIDGIDGLASGLSSVALLSYSIAFFIMGEYWYTMIAAAGLGVLVPFFYYNVFGDANKHRKIFMGDTGSLTIGMILCILAFKIMNIEDMPAQYKEMDVLVIAMSPLVIPCFDVIRVFFARLKSHKSPFLPDKSHIHHRLLSIGMTQRSAMITIVSSSILFTVFNAVLSMWLNVNLIIVIDFVVFYFTLKLAIKIARSRK